MKKSILSVITLTVLFSGHTFGGGILDILSSSQVKVLNGVLTAVENGKKGSRVSTTGFEAPEYHSYSCEKLEQAINDRVADRDHRVFEAEEIKKVIKDHDNKNVVHQFLIENFTSFSRDGSLWEGYVHMNASKIIDAEIYSMNRHHSIKCEES